MRGLGIFIAIFLCWSEFALANSCPQILRDFSVFHFSTGLGGRARGAKLAPAALKEAGLYEKLNADGLKFETPFEIAIEDFSNPAEFIEPPSGQPGPSAINHKEILLPALKDLRDRNLAALRAGKIPLNIGGDHSLEMAPLAAISLLGAERNQTINEIRFDAHPDFHTPRSSHSKNLHGMTLAHALRLADSDVDFLELFSPKVDEAQKILMIGIRDIDLGEWHLLDQLRRSQPKRITFFEPERVNQLGIENVMDQMIEAATMNGQKFHFSFDLDGIDPSIAPGVGTRVNHGLSLNDARYVADRIFAESQKGNVTSMDAVELDPHRDPSGASTKIMIEIISRLTTGRP